jgi:bacteriocin-like protein
MAGKTKSSKSTADELIETSKKGDVELTDDELKKISGGEGSEPSVSEIVVTKRMDKSSPNLW